MSASDGDGVSLQVRGPVATLVLDRPHKRNATQLRTWLALPTLMAAADREAVVGLLLVRGRAASSALGTTSPTSEC